MLKWKSFIINNISLFFNIKLPITNIMENLILYTTTFPKQRIGRHHDGGYVIVNLPGEYDLFISGGIANDISFEKDLLSLFPNINCYAFDGTINSLPPNNIPNLKFIRKNLGDGIDGNTTNLSEYMNNFNNIFYCFWKNISGFPEIKMLKYA